MTLTCINCNQPFVASRGQFCGARACQNEKRRAAYATKFASTAATPCENCGRPTATGGPKSKLRWCMDPECQRAKRRWIWAARQSDPDSTRIEDRRCSSCDGRLSKRPWRTTDSELGRWCRKAKCQMDRERQERAWMSNRRYWYDEMEHLTCPECGFSEGVRAGFQHPEREAWFEGRVVTCYAVGRNQPDPGVAEFAIADWKKARREHLAV